MAPDILHVDLDAFYVSVERGRDPELRGRPVIVGGAGGRGVVLSCSYEARERGVRNGMPSARARRLCRDAVFVPPNFEVYTEASKGFRRVLREFTPRIEPISLDEAFCDVSGAHRLYGSSEAIAHAIRGRVREELDLVCSVGAGPSKLVAKVASRACKPDGVLIVDDPVAFLHPLPIEELWGVGDATASVLRARGIATIGDLAHMPEGVLRSIVGDAGAAHLGRVSWGIDHSPVSSRGDAKSVGAEETFEHDIDDPEALRAELLRLADRVAARLTEGRVRGRTVTVKIRLTGFDTYTRSRTLKAPTADVWTIFAIARDAFESFRRGRRAVRLLGVSVSGVTSGPAAEQLPLEGRPDYREAEEAVSRVRKRFGRDAVRLARLLRPR